MQPVTLFRDFTSFEISQDGEPDDLQGLVVAAGVLKGRDVQIDCTIGNPKIVHVSSDPSVELEARVQFADQLFGRKVSHTGSRRADGISEEYVEGILKQASARNCLVLHTDSFKSLQALFNRAEAGTLAKVVIVAYGSVNIGWALLEKEQYKPFYESLKKSGATLVQVDAFPFLGERNTITFETTPLTYFLLDHLDGTSGKRWLALNESAQAAVRTSQLARIEGNIKQALQSAGPHKALQSLVSQVSTLFSSNSWNMTVDREKHATLTSLLKSLCTQLAAELKVEEIEISRTFSIFAKTTLRQALIADQIPAIIFSELVEKRRNGLVKECLQVQFEGHTSRYAQYGLTQELTNLYYLDTKKRIQASGSTQDEKKLIDSYLEYIDLCIAIAHLTNESMISSTKREELLRSPFKQELLQLAEKVQKSGFDLPQSFHSL